MAEINHAAMMFGMAICNDLGCVGTILHAYNMLLSQKLLFHPIPILELLCQILRTPVFGSEVPTKGFHSSYLCYMGAKIDFQHNKQEPRAGPVSSRTRKWTFGGLKVLPNVDTMSRGARSIQALNLSSVFAFRQLCCMPDSRFEIHVGNKKNSFTDQSDGRLRSLQEILSHYERMGNTGSAVAMSKQFINLAETVQHETTGSNHVIWINWFRVYYTCIRLLERVTEEAKSNGPLPPSVTNLHPTKAGRGVGLVSEWMRAADPDSSDYKSIRAQLGAGHANSLLQPIRKAFNEVLGKAKNVEDFAWDHLLP